MFTKFKKLFGAQDMTIGNPTLVLLKFAVPLRIGNIAQQLYSTVDAIIVGKYVGDNALAADAWHTRRNFTRHSMVFMDFTDWLCGLRLL